MKWLLLTGYVATVPAANWTMSHVGTVCLPDGPCLVPVWPGLTAPSGVLWIGLALTLRDLVHESLGRWWALAAIGAGALLSAAVSPPAIVVASTAAFLVSELADFGVYAPLRQRSWIGAIALSNTVGLLIDSALFLWLAFGSLDFLVGLVVAKLYVTLATVVVLWVMRLVRQRGPAWQA